MSHDKGMVATITISRRYCGPPESGNGGYVCGRLAGYIRGAAEVTLRRPTPLDSPLPVAVGDGRRVRLIDGSDTIAEAVPAMLDLDPPLRPTLAEARRAQGAYIGYENHPFPTCFGCGPRRRPRDGLRVFAAAVGTGRTVAAAWTPDPTLADGRGCVRPEFIWAALDCPGYFAVIGATFRMMLLGRMAADIHHPVAIGEPHVVVGWPVGGEGRKHRAATALLSASGTVCATALATWIDKREPANP
jgi:hypothetical protein